MYELVEMEQRPRGARRDKPRRLHIGCVARKGQLGLEKMVTYKGGVNDDAIVKGRMGMDDHGYEYSRCFGDVQGFW
jgi:hypothetical protein